MEICGAARVCIVSAVTLLCSRCNNSSSGVMMADVAMTDDECEVAIQSNTATYLRQGVDDGTSKARARTRSSFVSLGVVRRAML